MLKCLLTSHALQQRFGVTEPVAKVGG